MGLLDGLLGGLLGKVGEKIGDWIPNKSERYRAKIRQIKNRMDQLYREEWTVDNRCEYTNLARLLAEYEAKISDKG